jgi:hypothetical protein
MAESVRPKTAAGDYWQTGRDLWESKSGIITDPLGNLQKVPDDSRLFVMPGVVCGPMCRG